MSGGYAQSQHEAKHPHFEVMSALSWDSKRISS
jgi:hypothetical protein